MENTSAASSLVCSSARVTTPWAEKYVTQLCKHFAHKLPVAFEGPSGRISFPIGECRLKADGEELTMSLAAADDARLLQLQDVVARHLVRFAFREPMQIDWRPA